MCHSLNPQRGCLLSNTNLFQRQLILEFFFSPTYLFLTAKVTLFESRSHGQKALPLSSLPMDALPCLDVSPRTGDIANHKLCLIKLHISAATLTSTEPHDLRKSVYDLQITESHKLSSHRQPNPTFEPSGTSSSSPTIQHAQKHRSFKAQTPTSPNIGR